MICTNKQKVLELMTKLIKNFPDCDSETIVFNRSIEKYLKRENYRIDRGCYKVVLIPEEKKENWVIKVDLNSIYEYTDDFKSIVTNDCKIEYNNFKKMEDLGLDCFFAKIEYFDNIGTVPLYIQEKVLTYSEYEEDYLTIPLKENNIQQICKKLAIEKDLSYNEIIEEVLLIPEIWWHSAIKYYGEKKVKTFISYIIKGEDNIPIIWGDLHYKNFGFREQDGSPCILDFSS